MLRPEDLKYKPNKQFDEAKAATITYKNQKFVFDPYAFGIGLWLFHSSMKLGPRVAPKELQPILNKLVFGRAYLPSLKDQLKVSDQEKGKLTATSISWLTLKIKALKQGKAVPGSMVNTNRQVRIGDMFFMAYDAKFKDILEYWDAFPLDILLKTDAEHLWSANLHYLSPEYRVVLMTQLLPLIYNDSPTIRIKIGESIKTLIEKYPLMRPCLKCYLRSHIRSKLLKIETNEVGLALWLPVQSFQKKSAPYVWKDSLRIANKK